ncbi:MAG: hypothetical protein ACJ79A_03495 [Gemmatimonadaceae bacterium]
MKPGSEAAIPNPKLEALAPLLGTWATEGRHPYVPDTVLHGEWSFERLEGGAFILLRSSTREPEIPSGLAVFGTDDASDVIDMLYFDERGVSRRYEASMRDGVFRCWRNAPDFSQRFACTVAPDGRTMEARGELSRDGSTWEPDLSLTFTRIA